MIKNRKRNVRRQRGFYYVKNAKQQYPTTPTKLPMRDNKYSPYYNFFAKESITIEPNKITLVHTDVKAYMRRDEVLKIYPYTSNSLTSNITLHNGPIIIQSNYYGNDDNDGNIIIPLKNIGSEVVTIEAGDKIAVGIFEYWLKATNDYIDNTNNTK